MKDWDPTGKQGPKIPLPDVVTVHTPKEDDGPVRDDDKKGKEGKEGMQVLLMLNLHVLKQALRCLRTEACCAVQIAPPGKAMGGFAEPPMPQPGAAPHLGGGNLA